LDELKEHWNLSLNHHSPAPLWTQVARELRRRIVEWNLPVGHLLPGEQFLTDQYSLPPDTVQQAYQALQEAGQIGYEDGTGYFVAEAVPMQVVHVPPGSRITAPAAEPDNPDMPSWLVIAIKIEPPGMDPIWYDATRTTLIVSLGSSRSPPFALRVGQAGSIDVRASVTLS
jgi:DNA-binding transcriptional MocR family regulator